MSKSKLFVRNLAIFKSGRAVYQQKFHKGVNIIRGQNGTGKSTVVDILSYALGSSVTEWTDEQSACDYVYVEVEICQNVFCLQREITESGKARMKFFEGDLDTAINSPSGWLEYSYNRSNQRHSFSQQLFELLGLPSHKTDESKNLTMHQIMRLMYVDQLSAPTKLLKEDVEFDNSSYRRAIGEYLLGIDDLEAHNLRQDLIRANKKFEKINGELKAIFRLFGGEASRVNEEALNNEIAEVESELELLVEKKNAVIRSERHDLSDEVNKRSLELQRAVDELFCAKQDLEAQKSELSVELVDTELFHKSLQERKASLEDSLTAYSQLGGVQFAYCPSCLEPLSEHAGDVCGLCKSPSNSERGVAYVQMLNELNFQIRESETLISSFRNDIDKANAELPGINRRIDEAKFEYQQIESTIDNREALISEISAEMGFCRSQIQTLEERREHISKVAALQKERDLANDEIQKLEDQLALLSLRNANRYTDVYRSIEQKASLLLSKDGSYEPTFDAVNEVVFDFAKDKMFANGRSKFSASSMVVLKNSIRLSIFLHAVDDEYARLPNLLIMDNIEDKGMVVDRSQNFQRLIVSECSQLKDDFQLIFTTSMIDPELDGSEYCVGPMYPKGDHTLDFS